MQSDGLPQLRFLLKNGLNAFQISPSDIKKDFFDMSPYHMKFNYQMPGRKMIQAVVFMIIITLYVFYTAINNQKGLRLSNFLTFSPSEATTVFWVLFIILAVASIAAVIKVITNLQNPMIVELHEFHAVLPKSSLLGGQLNIPYLSMKNILVRTLTKNQKIIVVQSDLGESRLNSSYFKDQKELEDFLSMLSSKINI